MLRQHTKRFLVVYGQNLHGIVQVHILVEEERFHWRITYWNWCFKTGASCGDWKYFFKPWPFPRFVFFGKTRFLNGKRKRRRERWKSRGHTSCCHHRGHFWSRVGSKGMASSCLGRMAWPCSYLPIMLAGCSTRARASLFFLTSHEQGRVSCHLVVARPPSVRAFLYLNARIRQCWYPSVVGGASLRQSRMAATAAASIQHVRHDRPFSLVVKVEGPKATVVEDWNCGLRVNDASFFNEWIKLTNASWSWIVLHT